MQKTNEILDRVTKDTSIREKNCSQYYRFMKDPNPNAKELIAAILKEKQAAEIRMDFGCLRVSAGTYPCSETVSGGSEVSRREPSHPSDVCRGDMQRREGTVLLTRYRVNENRPGEVQGACHRLRLTGGGNINVLLVCKKRLGMG